MSPVCSGLEAEDVRLCLPLEPSFSPMYSPCSQLRHLSIPQHPLSHLHQNLLGFQGLLQHPPPLCCLCLQVVQSLLQLLHPGSHLFSGQVSSLHKLVTCTHHHLAKSPVTTDLILQILQRRKDQDCTNNWGTHTLSWA